MDLSKEALAARLGGHAESVVSSPGSDFAPAGWFVKVLSNGSVLGFYRLELDASLSIQEIVENFSVSEAVRALFDIMGAAEDLRNRG